MKRCVYCQGRVIPLVGRCRQCHRRQPPTRVLQPEHSETSREGLPNSGQVETQPLGELQQPLLADLPQRHFSRRALLRGVGVVGVVLGAGVVGREIYLLAQNHTLLTFRGHAAPVEALAWSPDSQWIASTSGAEVQIWEALSGRLLHIFPDARGFVAVAWSPDGAYLATGSWDARVVVWQVATGHQVLTYRGHVLNQGLASVPQAGLTTWSELSRLRPSTVNPPGIESLAWSPDGSRLLTLGYDRTTQVWEALTGQTLLRFDSAFEAAAWSPDGRHVLLRTNLGIERHLATTGALESTFSIGDDGVDGPSDWSPDGRRLATLASPAIDLWDTTTGRQLLTYEGHSNYVFRVVWSPDSRRIASAGYNLDVRVWNAGTGQTEYIYRGHMDPFELFFQGGLLPGTTDADPARSSPSMASAASLLKSASSLLPQDTGGSPHGISALAWAPNGRYVASGGSDNTIQVWQPG